MAAEDSVTCWLTLLKAGDERAAQNLWDRYFPQLIHLAQARLTGIRGPEANPEDVAVSVLATVLRRTRDGCFPRLADRTNLWKLLVVITARKAATVAGKVLRRPAGSSEGLEEIIGTDPTPEFAAQVAEEYRLLLERLPDDSRKLRAVANWKMEGYTNEEIAGKLGRSVARVEHRLQQIRHYWDSTRQDAGEPVE
jgi:DNA-directed RNA polymerase specialized sigma24 family protein